MSSSRSMKVTNYMHERLDSQMSGPAPSISNKKILPLIANLLCFVYVYMKKMKKIKRKRKRVRPGLARIRTPDLWRSESGG